MGRSVGAISSFARDGSSFRPLETSLLGVFELRPKMFRDARGFLIETYHRAKFAELGITDLFVQDNHSCSVKGTLRGLHYQLHQPQAKLCRVVEGEALDVAVDIRLGSPNFGKWTSVLLSAKEQNQIYVPIGFAHGFLALTDSVQFLYKCSDFYDPADEHGIVWSDPDLKIFWGVNAPVVSEKDAKYPTLAQVARELLPVHSLK
jgi:dTDP-4-dehydrorhamnose 3,5-epimerase